MADTRVDPDPRQIRHRRWRCVGRVTSTGTVALAALLLARGDPSPSTTTALVVAVWLWLAATVIVGILRMVKAVNAAASQKSANIHPFELLTGIPRLCSWAGALLVGVATGALFAAGQGTLAVTMELYLLWRLVLAAGAHRPCEPDRNAPAATVDYMPLTDASGIFAVCVTAGALWLALGTPPVWAEGMILTYFWIVTFGMIVVGAVAAYGWTVGRSWLRKHCETRQRSGETIDIPPSLTPTVRPEPRRSPGQQCIMWTWRASWLTVAWALWAAGQPLLAGLYLLACLLKLTVRVHARRERHGDTARIDVLARAVYFIVWWPLVAVGVTAVTAILVPFIVFGAIWDRIFGTTSTAPHSQMSWEHEQRLERARIRRAAASYRLREAFGKPAGFVYFMGSEPHQHEHFLGPGGLLAGLGDRVVARDYRRHVLQTRNTLNWRSFERAPEGALLHVNGISNMRRDLPFIAVVPSRGPIKAFRLSEPYRARMRDGGAALKRAEAEVGAAIAAAPDPDADSPSPDSTRASP